MASSRSDENTAIRPASFASKITDRFDCDDDDIMSIIDLVTTLRNTRSLSENAGIPNHLGASNESTVNARSMCEYCLENTTSDCDEITCFFESLMRKNIKYYESKPVWKPRTDYSLKKCFLAECGEVDAAECEEVDAAECEEVDAVVRGLVDAIDCEGVDAVDCGGVDAVVCGLVDAVDCKGVDAAECKEVEEVDCGGVDLEQGISFINFLFDWAKPSNNTNSSSEVARTSNLPKSSTQSTVNGQQPLGIPLIGEHCRKEPGSECERPYWFSKTLMLRKESKSCRTQPVLEPKTNCDDDDETKPGIPLIGEHCRKEPASECVRPYWFSKTLMLCKESKSCRTQPVPEPKTNCDDDDDTKPDFTPKRSLGIELGEISKHPFGPNVFESMMRDR